AYEKLFTPFLRAPHELLGDLLGPLRIPRHPIRLARFGLPGLLPATAAFRARFQGRRARAVLAGCATHSILPLERPLTAAVGTLFALTAHVGDWPIAQGGSQAIGRALTSYLRALGGCIETGRHVRSLADIPTARIVLFTPARCSSPTSAHRSCPRAMCAGSGATATAPAPSRSTGRSTGRSRGEIPAAWRRRPFISAARSTRSPPAKPPSGAESTPSGPSCSSS